MEEGQGNPSRAPERQRDTDDGPKHISQDAVKPVEDKRKGGPINAEGGGPWVRTRMT